MGHLLGSSMVGLLATSSKTAYATRWVTQVCCSQSLSPHGRPLLTHASPGDTRTLKGRSGSVSVGSLGPGAPKVSFEPSKHLWQVWALILNVIMPLLPLLSFGGFSFALGYGFFFFFWWDPTFSCWWLFSRELQFCSSRGRRSVHVQGTMLCEHKAEAGLLLCLSFCTAFSGPKR